MVESRATLLDSKVWGVTPDSARRSLVEGLGFGEHSWDRIVREGLASHEVRALIIIARGDKPQLLGVLTDEIRAAERRLADGS